MGLRKTKQKSARIQNIASLFFDKRRKKYLMKYERRERHKTSVRMVDEISHVLIPWSLVSISACSFELGVWKLECNSRMKQAVVVDRRKNSETEKKWKTENVTHSTLEKPGASWLNRPEAMSSLYSHAFIFYVPIPTCVRTRFGVKFRLRRC